MNKEREIYKELHSKYANFVWNPQFMPLLKIASPLIKRFKVEVEFEAEIPKDGSIIFCQNHNNFYDSLVLDQALKNIVCHCFASNEPRGKITGLSFEAKGVVWLDRDSEEDRKKVKEINTEILKHGLNLSWCPEGTWNLSENRLLLNTSWGLAQTAIEVSNYTNIYIIPVTINYDYIGQTAKVRGANVKVSSPIKVETEMDPKELTKQIETVHWTNTWYQLEEYAKKDKEGTIKIEDSEIEYVYKRAEITKEAWNKKIKALKAQYKTDWKREEEAVIKTKAQKEQEAVAPYIYPKRLIKIKK